MPEVDVDVAEEEDSLLAEVELPTAMKKAAVQKL